MVQRKVHLTTLTLSIGLLGLTIPALSADKTKDAPPAGDASKEVLNVAATAYLTADFGHEHRSPESLLAAAVMLHSLKFVKTAALADQPTDEKGKPIEEKGAKNNSFDEEANELFDEASTMALDMKIPGFDAVIKAAKSREARGLRGSSKVLHHLIGPEKTVVYHFIFVAGRPAPFAFRASKPLSLEVVHTELDKTLASGEFTTYDHDAKTPLEVKDKEKDEHLTFTIRNLDTKTGEYLLAVP